MHPLDLVGIDVGRRHLDRRRQVDDRLLLGRRLPDVHHRLADLERIGQFRLREAFRRILMDDLGSRHRRHQFLDQLRAIRRDLRDAGHVQVEHHAALRRRRRVVEVDDRLLRPVDRLEGAPDQLFPRLRQDLDHDAVRDQVFIDQLAAERIVGFRGRREADLDFLEAHFAQGLEHPELAIRPHRLDQRLVAVPQVDRTPDRRLGDHLARPRAVRQVNRRKRLVLFNRHYRHGYEPVSLCLGFGLLADQNTP